jgi:hypothetical protein
MLKDAHEQCHEMERRRILAVLNSNQLLEAIPDYSTLSGSFFGQYKFIWTVPLVIKQEITITLSLYYSSGSKGLS